MFKLRLKIATPERVVYESEADSVTCPTEMGEVTILPGHIPLVANISLGELVIKNDSDEKAVFVAGGFLQVGARSNIVVLADAAEYGEEIDIERAEQARERARQIMQEKTLGEEEYAETLAALERSLGRIRVARKKKYKDVGRTQSS